MPKIYSDILEIPNILQKMSKRLDYLERQKDPERLLTRKQVMELLQVKADKIRRLELEGHLKNVSPCGHPRYLYSYVQRLIKQWAERV